MSNLLGKITERNNLHLLINEFSLKTGVEVGVQKAEYSKYLLDNTDMFLYLVDTWKQLPNYIDPANISDSEQDICMQIAIKNLSDYDTRYKIIRKLSVDAAKDFQDSSLDFIYLDAQHTWNACTADLNAWYHKLKVGGIMSGHDFLNAYGDIPHEMMFEVETAVREFIANKSIDLFITYESWPTWYWRKTE
jgi:hypothetical protein